MTLVNIFLVSKTRRVPSADPERRNWSATFSRAVTVSACSKTSEMSMPLGLASF